MKVGVQCDDTVPVGPGELDDYFVFRLRHPGFAEVQRGDTGTPQQTRR